MAITVKTVSKKNYIDLDKLAYDFVQDLKANGFVQRYSDAPASAPTTWGSSTSITYILESGASINPYNTVQPWSLWIRFTKDKFEISALTSLQYDSTTGVVAQTYVNNTFATGTPKVAVGSLSIPSTNTTADPDGLVFFERQAFSADDVKRAYPLQYKLTLTDHGISFAMWESARDPVGNEMSWFVIQYPVYAATGLTTPCIHTPLFCFYGIRHNARPDTNTGTDYSNSRYDKVYKFVVCENDVYRPTASVDATIATDDQLASLPSTQQIAFLENGSYNIQLLGGLNTNRYVYPDMELDLFAFTSADVLPSNYTADLTLYNESTPRKYYSLPSTGVYGTVTRFMMLIGNESV